VAEVKKVAIVGSSGGNLFHSGGGDPVRLLNEIAAQCRAAGMAVEAALFIAAQSSMDQKGVSVPAELYVWDPGLRAFRRMAQGDLDWVNREAVRADGEIARQIGEGRIDGLILISCDPLGVNRQSVAAAVERQLPVAGTGGTSMGTVKSLGANVVALSGTTGTTNQTRAVSFALALSRYWKLPYRMAGAKRWREASISGVMTSSIPAFMAVLLIMSLAKIPALAALQEAAAVLEALPAVILAVIAARHMSDLGESTMIAGAIAGLLSIQGGVIGALIAGLAAGWLIPRVFQLCTQRQFPATSVNITSAVISGLIPGLVMLFAANAWTMTAGDAVRSALTWTLGLNPALAGLAFGLCMWPLILKGWYHAVLLPLILIEMEEYGNSFIGALDMAGLVMASAGILLAQIAFPLQPADRISARKPLWLNIGFGTFIEASYVYMARSKLVYGGAIAASGLAGAVIGSLGLKSTAYVPFFLAMLFSNDAWGFLWAMLTALLFAFTVGIGANWAMRRKRKPGLKESSGE